MFRQITQDTAMQVDVAGTPLLIMDDAADDPNALVQLAAQEDFELTSPYFPGPRAPVGKAYQRALMIALTPLLTQTFDVARFEVGEANYSLVSHAPSDLSLIQRFPHFDTMDKNVIAVLHYLCGPDHGGTGFYRHRATGITKVTEGNDGYYSAALAQEVKAGAFPPRMYIDGDTDLFERIYSVPAKFNRLIAYRGHVLHSGNIPQNAPLSTDPRNGRLTINTFLHG